MRPVDYRHGLIAAERPSTSKIVSQPTHTRAPDRAIRGELERSGGVLGLVITRVWVAVALVAELEAPAARAGPRQLANGNALDRRTFMRVIGRARVVLADQRTDARAHLLAIESRRAAQRLGNEANVEVVHV